MRLRTLSMALAVIGCGGTPAPGVPVAPAPGVPVAPAPAPRAVAARAALRLCTWNIAKLGHRQGKDFRVLGSVLEQNCDLAAILEVMQKGGRHPGYERLREVLGAGWTGTVTASPRPNHGAGHAEFYAALWRPEKVAWCESWSMLRYFSDNDGSHAGSGADRFRREPAYGCFQATPQADVGFDFLLGIYHATWARGDSAQTAAEVRQLELVVDEMKQARQGENDLLLAGDFNLVPAQLAAATRLDDWTEGSGSTLNRHGDRTANLYDHILLDSPRASPELAKKARVLDVRSACTSTRVFEQTVSDHLPLVLDIDVFQADDD
ncbi:MAG TPA: endonuclease/exonuclease/phosphatase family protein [Polyangiaceae bacterium]|nr:endonuclease/exonuclease/phosphatase family protein [Polyangiaceae bacterium]